MLQETPATAAELAKNLGVGGAIFLSSLWLLLKYRPWEQRKDHEDAETRDRLSRVESKVDVLWNFLLRRSISEGLNSGFLTRESPLKANVQILERHPEVIGDIKAWYETEGCQLLDLDLFVEIERRFNVPLHALCEHEGMMDGACLAAMFFMLRPESVLFEKYNTEEWRSHG